MNFEGYARRFPVNTRWAEEADKAASFLRDHPGSRPGEIADALGISIKGSLWVLVELTGSGRVVKTNGRHRGVRYYLKDQEIKEEDKDDSEIINDILKAAGQLSRLRKGAAIRARDIQYFMEEKGKKGKKVPTNYKISAVLTRHGYAPDESRSKYNGVAYVQVEDWRKAEE